MAGTCERGDERSMSIKCWNLLTNRGNVGFSKTVLCAPCSEFVCLFVCLFARLLLSTPSVYVEAHFRLVQ